MSIHFYVDLPTVLSLLKGEKMGTCWECRDEVGLLSERRSGLFSLLEHNRGRPCGRDRLTIPRVHPVSLHITARVKGYVCSGHLREQSCVEPWDMLWSQHPESSQEHSLVFLWPGHVTGFVGRTLVSDQWMSCVRRNVQGRERWISSLHFGWSNTPLEVQTLLISIMAGWSVMLPSSWATFVRYVLGENMTYPREKCV